MSISKEPSIKDGFLGIKLRFEEQETKYVEELLSALFNYFKILSERLPENHPTLNLQWKSKSQFLGFESFDSVFAEKQTAALSSEEISFLRFWVLEADRIGLISLSDVLGLKDKKIIVKMQNCIVRNPDEVVFTINFLELCR